MLSKLTGTFVQEVDTLHKKSAFPFKVALFTVQPFSESRLDCHKVLEVWLIAQGKGIVEYQGEEFSISAGDVLHFHSFETHKVINTGKEDIKLFSIWWE